jgi:ABC-type sulfate/molybdate transport systems ATPase subunit
VSEGLEIDVTGRVGALDLAVDLRVGPEPLVVLGPNGAGKTTLLLIALGIVRPEAGRVTCGGEVLFDARAGVDVPPEAREIAYLPQDFGLFPHLTAAGNVAFALACGRDPLPRAARGPRARALLAELGAAALAERKPAALSGGERQRVALARALARRPQALLLDEPFAALDPDARGDVRLFLRERLAAIGRPAVVVSHDVADARALGARLAIMEAGRVVQEGTLDDLARAPATPYVARLLAAVGS